MKQAYPTISHQLKVTLKFTDDGFHKLFPLPICKGKIFIANLNDIKLSHKKWDEGGKCLVIFSSLAVFETYGFYWGIIE